MKTSLFLVWILSNLGVPVAPCTNYDDAQIEIVKGVCMVETPTSAKPPPPEFAPSGNNERVDNFISNGF